MAQFNGTINNDILTGGDGSDELSGLAGDDVLEGHAGNDALNGGDGIDKARFAGASAGYLITAGGGSIFVVDTDPSNGNDGTDTLVSVELLQFADKTFADLNDDTLTGGEGDDF